MPQDNLGPLFSSLLSRASARRTKATNSVLSKYSGDLEEASDAALDKLQKSINHEDEKFCGSVKRLEKLLLERADLAKELEVVMKGVDDAVRRVGPVMDELVFKR